MSGAADGAPLRAMASLAAVWILLRVVSWNSAANLADDPAYPVITSAAYPDMKRQRQGLAGLSLSQKIRQNRHPKYQFSVADIAERDAAASFIAERANTRAAHLSGLPWQASDEVRDFFLSASFTGSADISRNASSTVPRFPGPPSSSHRNRIAGYFWIHARQDSTMKQVLHQQRGRSISNGQYGGSQAGAILSYRPLPEISLYGRLSAALAPFSQQEIALGTRIQPVRNLPVALHAEQRMDASSGDTAGTAFYATGGTGPDPIVEKFALETYAQGGYVLGHNETYFFDGSATLRRPVAEFDGNRLAVGAGVWAGGQRQISRLDVGPHASLELPLGTALTRIAVDARVRVAGNARPGSGAALTVSTSF